MNEFLYCYKKDPVVSLQPLEGCHSRLEQGDYFEKLLLELDRLTASIGIKFFLTWNLNKLAVTGSRVVAIVVGDERCQVPADTDKVLMTFRTGTQSLVFSDWLRSRMCFVERVLECGRFVLKVVSRTGRWLRGQAKLFAPDNVFSIPLMPCWEAHAIPPPPINQRKLDVSFFGTVGPTRKMGKRWRFPASPKAAARLKMLGALNNLMGVAPKLTINIGCDGLPEWCPLIAPAAYADALRDTKISLCPRGNFAETFRLVESARIGCVVITDPLPKEWYFAGHPFIEIQKWSDLPEMVMRLMADPHRLQELSEKSVAWWHTCLAPEAVAAYMLKNLKNQLELHKSGQEHSL